jgi:serine phosphatase RsbU (regulator of sigma subunit)
MAGTYRIFLAGLRKTDNALALKHFTTAGHVVSAVEELSQADERFRTAPPDLVYLQASATSNALADLRQMRQLCGETPVVLLTDQPSADLALQLWHEGAADCIPLPLSAQSLDESLNRATRRLPAGEAAEPAGVQGRLRYLDAAGKEHWAAVIPPKFTVGRSSENDLVFAQMNISRFHAEIITENSGYVLRDLGSKHGTWVNGNKIEQKVLADGDRIQFGGVHGQSLTFRQGDLLQSLLSISEVSSQAGLSIRGFREMGLLLSTLRALSSISLLDDLLSLVVDTAIELTGAERGFIMLQDADGNLSFRCARNNYRQPLDGTSFKTSRRVPNEVFETGKRKVINDLDLTNLGDHSSTRQLGVRSIVCVPLRYWAVHDTGADSTSGRVETIGVLYVDSPSIAERLSETQIDALDTLASEAAMAIYNARLYKESQEKRKLDEELAIAREIQQALLPAPERVLPFVRACSQNLPCREVGGDYFDYFEIEGGRLGFALGDVAGKGMPAALLTSVLQGIFSGQALLNLPLHSLISNVNKNIVKRGPGNRFVTLFFGILDPDGNLTYVNAGHNPPFVVGPDGSLRELTEGGMVLGIFPEAEYQSDTVTLNPGDHLVLFTDGVVEALNTSGDEFGEERLRKLLQAHATAPSSQILARIREAVASFSADTPQHDDITMMVMGYREVGEEGNPGPPGHLGFH